MTEYTMSTQVFDALKVILDEFGNCDLGPRLDHFSNGDDSEQERGRQLHCAFSLVRAWSNDPTMTPDDIRDSLEASDEWWKGFNCEAA
jgi:hypothetical protein